jgi:hypothetical protein
MSSPFQFHRLPNVKGQWRDRRALCSREQAAAAAMKRLAKNTLTVRARVVVVACIFAVFWSNE